MTSTSLHELRRSLAGEVIGPEDEAYDAARRCYNALVDRRPAVIARCAGPGDVELGIAGGFEQPDRFAHRF